LLGRLLGALKFTLSPDGQTEHLELAMNLAIQETPEEKQDNLATEQAQAEEASHTRNALVPQSARSARTRSGTQSSRGPSSAMQRRNRSFDIPEPSDQYKKELAREQKEGGVDTLPGSENGLVVVKESQHGKEKNKKVTRSREHRSQVQSRLHAPKKSYAEPQNHAPKRAPVVGKARTKTKEAKGKGSILKAATTEPEAATNQPVARDLSNDSAGSNASNVSSQASVPAVPADEGVAVGSPRLVEENTGDPSPETEPEPPVTSPGKKVEASDNQENAEKSEKAENTQATAENKTEQPKSEPAPSEPASVPAQSEPASIPAPALELHEAKMNQKASDSAAPESKPKSGEGNDKEKDTSGASERRSSISVVLPNVTVEYTPPAQPTPDGEGTSLPSPSTVQAPNMAVNEPVKRLGGPEIIKESRDGTEDPVQ
jgi:hypothetical protein